MKKYTIKAVDLDSGEVKILSGIYTGMPLEKGKIFTYQRCAYKMINWRKRRYQENEFVVLPKYKIILDFVDDLLLSLNPKDPIWKETLKDKETLKKIIYGEN